MTNNLCCRLFSFLFVQCFNHWFFLPHQFPLAKYLLCWVSRYQSIWTPQRRVDPLEWLEKDTPSQTRPRWTPLPIGDPCAAGRGSSPRHATIGVCTPEIECSEKTSYWTFYFLDNQRKTIEIIDRESISKYLK